MRIVYQTLFILLFPVWHCSAQDRDSLTMEIQNLPGRFLAKIQKKYSSLEAILSKKTTRYLNKMKQQEKRLRRKAGNADTSYISTENIDSIYSAFSSHLSVPQGKVNLHQYSPFMDTLSTSLAFLQKYKSLGNKVKLPTDEINKLKNSINGTEKVKAFIAQRRQQIKTALSKYTNLPSSLKKQYTNIQKTAYYYSAQVKEYKDMLNDPEKIEKKAIGLLAKMPFFQNFMKENSQLASLFRLPPNTNGSSSQSLAGLQTRSSVQGMIQQRLAAGGPNAISQVKHHMAEAQSKLTQLKEKLSKISSPGGNMGEDEMPDFNPNSQKTRRFLKRLEYSANTEFGKSNNYLPSTTKIGMGIGYKLDDKRIIGIGADYSLGMGTIQHISITSQGVGLKSYVSWKVKKQIFVTGGYEMNYNSAFKKIAQLKTYDAWQRSALIGLSRKYQVTKKLKGNLQLLYDFLANDHVPVSQPVIFRLGYIF